MAFLLCYHRTCGVLTPVQECTICVLQPPPPPTSTGAREEASFCTVHHTSDVPLLDKHHHLDASGQPSRHESQTPQRVPLHTVHLSARRLKIVCCNNTSIIIGSIHRSYCTSHTVQAQSQGHPKGGHLDGSVGSPAPRLNTKTILAWSPFGPYNTQRKTDLPYP
ncbi:hypothetical protein BKA70DRAFT_1444054 [Coprinopsis sp. MPI-PUGE-AT-0042]|nr:hypothetical protein BKA70DRAFT_1444054 [Coprinopsis sp. MPI-PUGE-AT-0042]